MRNGLRAAVVGLVAATMVAAPRQASADAEGWLWVENRVPIVRRDRPEAGRIDLRVFGDFRLNRRSEGLHLAFARVGPLFFLSDWLFVGTHGTLIGIKTPDGRFDQSARAELEPNIFFRIGDFAFNDRNRGEYRYRQGLADMWVYRNQLRISYAPPGARWIPYLWDEGIIDLSGSNGFMENRASAGLGRMVGETTRIDLGYMVRSRKAEGAWAHDHVLSLYFFFDVAKPAPPREPPTALPAPGLPIPASEPPAPPPPPRFEPAPDPVGPAAPPPATPPAGEHPHEDGG